MSILINEAYANPVTPLWAKEGTLVSVSVPNATTPIVINANDGRILSTDIPIPSVFKVGDVLLARARITIQPSYSATPTGSMSYRFTSASASVSSIEVPAGVSATFQQFDLIGMFKVSLPLENFYLSVSNRTGVTLTLTNTSFSFVNFVKIGEGGS